jgi:ferritin-like metal-binding protein YciE
MTTIEAQLVSYIEDAHALEQMMELAIQGMMSSAPDFPEFQDPLSHHLEETRRHKALLEERLRAHGGSTSKSKDTAMMFGALGLAALNKVRSDTAGKVARDGYAAEHLEIASYELLERVATRAGDEQTAEVARRNKADEVAMAEKLGSSWDLALDLSLKQEGLEGAPPISPPGGMEGAKTPPGSPSRVPPEQNR